MHLHFKFHTKRAAIINQNLKLYFEQKYDIKYDLYSHQLFMSYWIQEKKIDQP